MPTCSACIMRLDSGHCLCDGALVETGQPACRDHFVMRPSLELEQQASIFPPPGHPRSPVVCPTCGGAGVIAKADAEDLP